MDPAELLRRVFFIDVLLCDACGGPRRLLAFITDLGSIRRILVHFGLPALPPTCAPADRGPCCHSPSPDRRPWPTLGRSLDLDLRPLLAAGRICGKLAVVI